MSEVPEAERPKSRHRRTIPAHCTTHGGTVGFTNLVVRKIDGTVEFDPHATGACVLVLDEAGVTALFDALGEWLG